MLKFLLSAAPSMNAHEHLKLIFVCALPLYWCNYVQQGQVWFYIPTRKWNCITIACSDFIIIAIINGVLNWSISIHGKAHESLIGVCEQHIAKWMVVYSMRIIWQAKQNFTKSHNHHIKIIFGAQKKRYGKFNQSLSWNLTKLLLTYLYKAIWTLLL